MTGKMTSPLNDDESVFRTSKGDVGITKKMSTGRQF